MVILIEQHKPVIVEQVWLFISIISSIYTVSVHFFHYKLCVPTTVGIVFKYGYLSS